MTPPPVCCDRMEFDLAQACDQHPDRFDCPDALIVRKPDGACGLIVHDGGGSFIQIAYCPWCGAELPEHREEEPEEVLERLARNSSE